ncbi:threonine synthase [Salinarchaeum sp. Harcht-Bsk1]|uniref:threonine synthase n=1 Tax=Salinarchaeum sp. Harcht-Bsk1 TaxID=1333523 RepID=UPI00034231C0|nr:pyridoxal-phosphate dependent enzyme [Salinarchaeum sp. Harcht-Bsk1]AGN02956.1 threonine synthase [Salinarchaeum sp. Harcht-Bsk1]
MDGSATSAGTDDESLATGQRSLKDRSIEYPLWPPQTGGCPETSDEAVQYPVEVTYEYEAVPDGLFEGPIEHGIDQWQPLLPPLAEGTSLGEGNTPLLAAPDVADWAGAGAGTEVYVKDESRNPTWSQKDRLARLTVSASVGVDAPGIVVSSSGNHGAATAAYGARAGLSVVVFTSPDTPAAVQQFVGAYDTAILQIPDWHARQEAVDRLAATAGYHPVSSRTAVPTGHPWGPEGYKTIAYELFLQLDRRVPGTVFVPTAHAEVLYGVWKGFRELESLGVTAETPRMIACEPAARAPHVAALESEAALPSVAPGDTDAHSIQATQATYHGVTAIDESDGDATGVTDDAIAEAQALLAARGCWQEFSGAAGVAGLREAAADFDGSLDGPIVCLATSSGFKDGETLDAPTVDGSWESIRNALRTEYGLLE